MHAPPTICPPPRLHDRPRSAEPRDEIPADRQSRRRPGFTPRPVPQLRWFAWTLVALVGLCLLLAAWVWAQILRAGL
jgi:hypothetical protein